MFNWLFAPFLLIHLLLIHWFCLCICSGQHSNQVFRWWIPSFRRKRVVSGWSNQLRLAHFFCKVATHIIYGCEFTEPLFLLSSFIFSKIKSSSGSSPEVFSTQFPFSPGGLFRTASRPSQWMASWATAVRWRSAGPGRPWRSAASVGWRQPRCWSRWTSRRWRPIWGLGVGGWEICLEPKWNKGGWRLMVGEHWDKMGLGWGWDGDGWGWLRMGWL